jgi:tetratricopeptide (TPR) repeat protein
MQPVTSQQLLNLWTNQCFEELERACLGGLAAGQDHAPIRYFLGLARLEMHAPSGAMAPLETAVIQRPEEPAYRVALARVHCNLGNKGACLFQLGVALALDPGLFDAAFRLSLFILDQSEIESGLAWSLRCLALANMKNPELALIIHTNCMHAYFYRHRNINALLHNIRCLALAPGNGEVLRLGGALAGLSALYDFAHWAYSHAIDVDSQVAQYHFERGMMDLVLGRFESGWRNYELRKQVHRYKDSVELFGTPEWQCGQSLRGKRILLTYEQGIGDTIQFSRFATDLNKAGAKVLLLVQACLAPLIRSVPGVHWSQVITPGQTLPHHDFHCLLMSLPNRLNLRLDTIPASVPYISVSAEHIKFWRAELARRLPVPGPRIGLVWSGNPQHFKNATRSIPAQLLAPLFELENVSWVSLTHELSSSDRDQVRSSPNLFLLADHSNNSFVDAAAVVALCDAVISVDTSFAHLAGAMGRPLFLALSKASDFRWLATGDTSPWYPTARLFRQHEIDDWQPVINALVGEMEALRDGFCERQSEPK